MLIDALACGPVLAAPLILFAVGLMPAEWANARPRRMTRLSGAAAWLALAGAVLAATLHAWTGKLAWTICSIALPGRLGAVAISVFVDTVTVIMLLLVSFVGAVVTRYARNYLDGDPNQGRFNKWLALTLAAILTLIASGNLLMFALAWTATSLCLHQLLMFYSERQAAALSAHKKFVASRISDLSLLIAIVLVGSTLHTLQFQTMFQRMSSWSGRIPVELDVAAMFVVLSAALKSAQFPFHGWLIQVMEAPTPVSALLHAGIVNAGAFLVIRMSPVMSHSPWALAVLAVIGVLTLSLASLVMLTQTSIKVSLAWSTTAQMGFMLLECGLGLYSLAMLHLVAHSLYKAHAFLASGSGVDTFRAPDLVDAPGGFHAVRMLVALIASGLVAVGVGAAFGVTLARDPALMAAAAIVVIATSQLLLQTASMGGGKAGLLRGLGLCVVVSVAYFVLHAWFDMALHGSVVPVQGGSGAFELVLSLLIVAVFLALTALQQMLKHAPTALGDGLYMHLRNGLYIDVYITRLLQRVWPAPAMRSVTQTVPFATAISHEP